MYVFIVPDINTIAHSCYLLFRDIHYSTQTHTHIYIFIFNDINCNVSIFVFTNIYYILFVSCKYI